MARYNGKWAPIPRAYMMDADKPLEARFLLTLLYAWAEYEPRIAKHRQTPIALIRGQVLTSHKEISDNLALQDSRYRQAGRFLKRLADDGEISIQNVKNGVIITCLKYPAIGEKSAETNISKDKTLGGDGQSVSLSHKGDDNIGGVTPENGPKKWSDLGSQFPCPTREIAGAVESDGTQTDPLLRNSIIGNKSISPTIPLFKSYSMAAADTAGSGNGKGTLRENLNPSGEKPKTGGGVVIPMVAKKPGRVSGVDDKRSGNSKYAGVDLNSLKQALESEHDFLARLLEEQNTAKGQEDPYLAISIRGQQECINRLEKFIAEYENFNQQQRKVE